jgi:hypothetical protein
LEDTILGGFLGVVGISLWFLLALLMFALSQSPPKKPFIQDYSHLSAIWVWAALIMGALVLLLGIYGCAWVLRTNRYVAPFGVTKAFLVLSLLSVGGAAATLVHIKRPVNQKANVSASAPVHPVARRHRSASNSQISSSVASSGSAEPMQ